MIIIPEKEVIYVSTPRTGSRSMAAALVEGTGHKETEAHHPWPHEVMEIKDNTGYEVWTLIREPTSQMKSWISHCRRWGDPLEFILTHEHRCFRYDGGMNIYNQVQDKAYVVEKDGHSKMLQALGVDVEVPHIGESGSKYQTLTREQEAAIYRRFMQDFALYSRSTQADGRRIKI